MNNTIALIELILLVGVQLAAVYFIVKLAVKKSLKEYDEKKHNK